MFDKNTILFINNNRTLVSIVIFFYFLFVFFIIKFYLIKIIL